MKAKSKKSPKITLKKRLMRIVVWVGALLLIPMVLTVINPNATINGGKGGGWDWTFDDFVVMGVLLFVTGLAIDFVARKITNPTYRIWAIIAIILSLLFIWIELAVDGVTNVIYYLLH